MSALPDLTIWDSIRERADARLKNLVKTLEAEIAKDQTLADLIKTVKVRFYCNGCGMLTEPKLF
jgi:hypothetical protein